ncbi:MAG TPA: hypothetical protein VIN10_03465, partial [Bacteroidales bacterium]
MLKRILNSFIFLLVLPLYLIGQEPAQLNCVEVLADGSVTIWWTPPSNSTGFDKYEIYYSPNGISFTKIDEINTPLTNHYDDLNTNANLASRYYFVKVIYAVGEANSDTLQSIFLQLDNNAPLYNQADLFWNALSNPSPGGSSGIYKIFEEYPIGNWFERATTTSLTETLDVIVCLDSISFRIEMENSSGCKSVSNISGAIFKDAIYPLKPDFDSVSINNLGEAVLGWQPAADTDVEGYIIYRLENAAWIEIQRIDGYNSVFYTDASVDPCENVFTYAIAAFDSCGNKSPGTFSEPLNTILIEDVVFDVCSMSNTVTWSPYINAQPSLEGYKIYCSVDGSPFSQAGFVAPDQLSFVHSGLLGGSNYNYFVQAVFGGKSSTSCQLSVTTYSYQEPQFVYLANASVLASNEVELTIDVDTLVNTCTWEIWSSSETDPTPKLIASISRSELTGFPLVYTDESADAATAYYNYYIIVVDSCGNNALESNQVTTIKLSGSQPAADLNQLDWTAFNGWEEGIEKYYIFRIVGDEIPTLPFDSVSPTTLTYQDDIASIDNTSGVFGYWVQAKQNSGNSSYREASNSNRIYLAEESSLYMPNAFRPGGNSAEYKPVYQYFTGTQYLFQIYNRWGQLIFETSNPEEGWNG